MSYSLQFLFYKTSRIICIENVIGFFPKQGYVFFTGYSCVQPSDLPFTIECEIYDSTERKTATFYLQLTEVYKKDLPLPQSVMDEPHTCDSEDCCITLFPNYISIFKFTILNMITEYPTHNWEFSIDNRFESPEKLVERYLSLVEIPDYSSFTNDHNEGDKTFYVDFYNLTW
jgi:hypothetical protein